MRDNERIQRVLAGFQRLGLRYPLSTGSLCAEVRRGACWIAIERVRCLDRSESRVGSCFMMSSWPAWIGAHWSLCFWICDSERPSDRRQAQPGFPKSSSNVHQTILFEASFLDVTSGSKIQNPGSGPLAVPAGQCEDPLSGSWILDLKEIAFFGPGGRRGSARGRSRLRLMSKQSAVDVNLVDLGGCCRRAGRSATRGQSARGAW